MKRILTYFSILCLTAMSLDAASLKCAFSSDDISPAGGGRLELAGFAARKQLSDGMHLPLRTYALAITDGERKVCIISNDLMEIPPDLADGIRSEISRRSGLSPERILLHCIHTHSAPRIGGACSVEGGTNAGYRSQVFNTIVSNAVKVLTDESLWQEFSLEVARGSAGINYNRCEKNGPVDHDLYAARFVDRKGRPICAFINFACHPVCMGPSSLLVSSDYSGVARREIARKWGCEVFQLTGAGGNMDPVGGCLDAAHAEKTGHELYRSLEKMKFTPAESRDRLAFASRHAALPFSIPEVTPDAVRAHADSLAGSAETDFPRFAEDVRGWEKEILARFETGTVENSLDFEMAAVNIDGVIFFFSQGEPFCEYQMAARATFPDKMIFFAGYTGGQNSYLPSAHAYKVRKGYEYEIEQMHVYIKAPYPLSEEMPAAYQEAVFKTIAAVGADERYSIIPAPRHLEPREGEHVFTGEPQVKYLDDDSVPEEGYILDITPKRITVSASSEAGRFYAMQTIMQLLPAEVYGDGGFAGRKWSLPCCRIEDWPEYGWRGMHMDCGRWFHAKEEIYRFLDMMAMHKQNVFHWHLTEDQGWRIEIRKYPRLTEVGAWRSETCGYDGPCDGRPHGGWYSQDDIRDVVAYAAGRFITVVPEIELPGHSSAAIAAYPWLSCTPDEPKEVSTHWGVMEDVYCPSPRTFRFLEDVFTEVLELFPSRYYHIGGDECPKTAWRNSGYCHRLADSLGLSGVDDLQYYFVKHFDAFLRERGKTVIGWDEILDGSAVKSTVVMSYRGHAPASKAFARDMKVILAPNRWCYYDYVQDEIEDIPENQHLFITLRKAYTYDFRQMVDPEVLARADSLLLGFQACLWGEAIHDDKDLQHHAYPRSAAMAELSWSPAESRDWNSFRLRVEKEFERVKAHGQEYSDAYWQVIINMDLESDYPRSAELELDYPFADIRYTVDGSEPSADSPLAPYRIRVDKGMTLKARGFKADGTPVGRTVTRIF